SEVFGRARDAWRRLHGVEDFPLSRPLPKVTHANPPAGSAAPPPKGNQPAVPAPAFRWQFCQRSAAPPFEGAGEPAEPPAAVSTETPQAESQAAAVVPVEESPLETTIKTLKGSSKAKSLVKFLDEQTSRKATLRAVTRRLYTRGREPTAAQQETARQLIRRTAEKLDRLDAPCRVRWDWDRDEIELVGVAANPGPAKPSGKDVVDVAK